jgi:hypothetical protein
MYTVLVVVFWFSWLFSGCWAWKRYCDRGDVNMKDDSELFSMILIVIFGPTCLVVDLVTFIVARKRDL